MAVLLKLGTSDMTLPHESAGRSTGPVRVFPAQAEVYEQA